MRKNKWYIFLFMLMHVFVASAQPLLNNSTFFEEDGLITMDLSTDLKKLISEKKLDTYQPATVTCRFPDSSVITEQIRLSVRGEFRRNHCFIPTMRLDFKNPTSPKLSPLRKLKLVCGCGTGPEDERLVLKEFLVYKMYNLLTDMSFRVRLVRINYSDTRKRIKSYSQYGFLIEDVDVMARRNQCYEVQKPMFLTEQTNRQQMTLVAIFQYMIGNTDWSIPNYHNVKLMRPVTDTFAWPYTIPYDFDFCGIVNADYAAPNEELGIKSVKQRLYRGFPRNMPELQSTLDIFREKKEAINQLVQNFELLNPRHRKDIMTYLDEFYKTIENKKMVEREFISNARKS